MEHTDEGHRERQWYETYVLRLWRNDEGSLWRISLQSVKQDKPYYFSSLDELMLFLRQQHDSVNQVAKDNLTPDT